MKFARYLISFCIALLPFGCMGSAEGETGLSPWTRPEKLTDSQVLKRARSHFPKLAWRVDGQKLQVSQDHTEFSDLDLDYVRKGCAYTNYCRSVLESQLYYAKLGLTFPVETVKVRTTTDFLHKIRPNRKIILDADRLDLVKDFHRGAYQKFLTYPADTPFFHIEPHHGSVILSNVPNLEIVGREGRTEIVHHVGDSEVLYFTRADNLKLKNVTLYHSQPYPCRGGVLNVVASKNVIILDSEFRGSGVTGIHLDSVDGAVLERVTITDNNLSALIFEESKEIIVRNSIIEKNTTVFDLMWSYNSNVVMENVVIRDNSGVDTWPPYPVDIEKAIMGWQNSRVLIRNSSIENDQYHRLFSHESAQLVNTVVRNNALPGSAWEKLREQERQKDQVAE